MKEKDFSRADLPFPLFSLKTNVQLAFLTLIEGQIQQGTPPYFVSLFDPTTNTPFYSAYKVLPEQAAKLSTHRRPEQDWSDPPST